MRSHGCFPGQRLLLGLSLLCRRKSLTDLWRACRAPGKSLRSGLDTANQACRQSCALAVRHYARRASLRDFPGSASRFPTFGKKSPNFGRVSPGFWKVSNTRTWTRRCPRASRQRPAPRSSGKVPGWLHGEAPVRPHCTIFPVPAGALGSVSEVSQEWTGRCTPCLPAAPRTDRP